MPHNHIHRLVDRILQGTATEEEKAEMQQYFNQHGLQEEAPEQDRAFYPRKEQSAGMYNKLLQYLGPDSISKVYRINTRWLHRIAAVVIPLALTGGGIYYLFSSSLQNKPELVQTLTEIRNNSNSVRYLKLKDGSEIWMNKNTVLKLDTFNFAVNRKISLQGEAFFDVAQDPVHPFTVSTGQLNTLVLGTSFSVNSNNSCTNITLFTGKISLQTPGTPSQLLTPGQSGEYDQRSGTIRLAKASPYAIAWKTKEIDCKNEKMETIIHHLQDYYNIKIKFSKHIAGKQFSGTLSLQGNITSVLDRLLFVHQLQHRKNQDGSILIF